MEVIEKQCIKDEPLEEEREEKIQSKNKHMKKKKG